MSHNIGDVYGGGKIFYISPDGLTGLIVAPENQSTGIQWYNGINIITGAIDTAIGTGQANTAKIIDAQGVGSYAAQLCNDLILGRYNDWFLPSKDEIHELYLQMHIIGIPPDSYWSSVEKMRLQHIIKNFVMVDGIFLGRGRVQQLMYELFVKQHLIKEDKI
ncbi:MAG: hypothetical protein WC623_24430 [Pedobacter sp.]|uniref:hypothetical protein n=1 Tax=Pedobacter sp. TaxID=1411316 RepID=UPI003561FAC0